MITPLIPHQMGSNASKLWIDHGYKTIQSIFLALAPAPKLLSD
jgi:hypothetical protein